MSSTKAGVPCQCVYRSLVLLEALAGHSSARLTDLARQVNLNKATAHRLLVTMQARGFVVQSEDTQEYSLGPRLGELERLHSEARGAAELGAPAGDEPGTLSLRHVPAEREVADEADGTGECGLGSCALA